MEVLKSFAYITYELKIKKIMQNRSFIAFKMMVCTSP